MGAASRDGEFPAGLWGDAISNWPQGAAAKANVLFHERMRRLPPETIVQVRHEVGRWLEDPWVLLAEENESYALELFDDLVSGLLSGGEQGTDSGLGEVYIGGGPVEKSRRTLDHAINGPIGSATRALLSALAKREPAQGDRYASRILITLPAIAGGFWGRMPITPPAYWPNEPTGWTTLRRTGRMRQLFLGSELVMTRVNQRGTDYSMTVRCRQLLCSARYEMTLSSSSQPSIRGTGEIMLRSGRISGWYWLPFSLRTAFRESHLIRQETACEI